MVHGLLEAQPVAASPTGVFEQAALQAMRGWRYAMPGGAPIGRHYRQVLVFDPQADALPAGDGVLAAGGACHVVTGSHICRNYAVDGAAAVAH